jgi:1-deoxy-D-xylulose-5-phosphate reductoisomerase
MKYVTILGATGSIGLSALRVIRTNPQKFKVFGLSCNRNLKILSQQIEEFNPFVVAIVDASLRNSDELSHLMEKNPEVEFLFGDEGVVELAARKCDIVLSAIVGAAGLRPSLAAIGNCRRIALANKETLVMAGSIFIKLIAESGTELLPVDSEHSAVFMLMRNVQISHLERIILTASGGSLRDLPLEDLPAVTPEIALKHPTWSMGNKITIDSATLMNKGLEVIEAHHLFGVSYDKIDVLIHPESVIHSMIETIDGSVYAHMGEADMALPIINAFTYPDKIRNEFGRLDFVKLKSLTFRELDKRRYPSLDLCYAAGMRGGNAPAILNAANEECVYAFLERKIAFTDIVKIIEKVLSDVSFISDPDIDDIFKSDKEARILSRSYIKEYEK